MKNIEMTKHFDTPLCLKVRAAKPIIATYTRVHRDRKNDYRRQSKYHQTES